MLNVFCGDFVVAFWGEKKHPVNSLGPFFYLRMNGVIVNELPLFFVVLIV